MLRRYFGVGLPFIGELTEAGAAGRPYGIDSAAFIARYVPEMTSIVQLRDSMFQVAREGAQAKANAAERRLSVNAAIGLAILLIEISVFVIIQRRVLKPLLANTRAMVAITEGKLDTELPVGARTDEIGDIQKAVVALRETSRGKRALEIERETLIDQLRVASDVDFLTNLPNRRAFAERTAQQLELARRHGWKIALVLFDIDHFKQVNDLYGHAAGDVVLVRLAAAAQLEFRAADVLARHGGEEFIAMIFDCGADDALALVERVRAAFERIEFQAADGNVYGVTSSFGVTTAHAADVIDTGLLIRVADQALYLAKVGGRNRVVCRAFENVTARDEPATPPRRDSTDSAMHPI